MAKKKDKGSEDEGKKDSQGKEKPSELLSKLSKKMEEGEQINLLEYPSDEGRYHEKMLNAIQLLQLSLELGIWYTDANWDQFFQIVQDEKKLLGLVGDMKLHVQLHHPGGPNDDKEHS